jgi:hypothetical protein
MVETSIGDNALVENRIPPAIFEERCFSFRIRLIGSDLCRDSNAN